MNELIALLFLSREVAHREHLKAKGKGSHAAHMALGDGTAKGLKIALIGTPA